MTDPWAAFPDAPGHAESDPWASFPDAPKQEQKPTRRSRGGARVAVHDGDTLRLPDGRNGRLFGADAFELGQPGFAPDGSRADLGGRSRDALVGLVADGFDATPAGSMSYGRPVVTLNANGRDVGGEMIGEGMAVAAPGYLRADPMRLGEYMEAERLARLNRRGAHADQFQMPDAYRHKEPWAPAEISMDGKGVAVFPDEPTPFQGLRPEIERGYIALAQRADSTAEDLLAYAKANGFTIGPKEAASFVKRRAGGGRVSDQAAYGDLPKPLTNIGDGAGGAAARGFADPINMLDEAGAVVDTLGGTPGRENVWNSDRRFGDVLYNNIDQNRSILGYDDAFHPYARFGGQLAGGLMVPGGAVEGVGFGAARAALRAGSGRLVAEAAAKSAIRNRLALTGTIEGALAGGGAGEGGAVERLPGTLAGAGIGAGFGVGTAALGGAVAPIARAALGRGRRAVEDDTFALKGSSAPRASAEPVSAVADSTAPALAPSTAAPLKPVRPARTLTEAREHALDFVGEPIRNEATGVEATVSGMTLKKMTSGKALGKSTSEDDHALAVANVDDLFRRAELVDRRGDDHGEPTIAAISRWHAPLETPNGIRTARMAVKETRHPNSPNPLYTVETIELEGGGARFGAEASRPGQNRNLAPTGSDADIASTAGIDNAPRLGRPRRVDAPATAADMANLALSVEPGGVKDGGGDLRAGGIDNKARDLDFAKSEGFLGRLVNPAGMQTDEAAEAAWRAGYFPNHAEPPSEAEFLDAVATTHRGGSARVFHPDDYAAVDDFYRARDQRHAVERAQAEGSPIAEQIGEPVSLADLDANQPPATAYEDLPAVGARAGNIALDKLDSPNDIRRALQSVEAKVGGFDAARRGKISHGETAALAREMGMTPEDLLKRRPGQALNAEQALAARAILAKSGDELVNMARRLEAMDNPGDEALGRFRESWVRHVAIQEQVSGATAEAGRALAQFRVMADSRAAPSRVLASMIDGGGGTGRIRDVARAIVDLDEAADAAGINRFTAKAVKPRFRDKLVELYYNSLLSGPQTHAVNMLSNTLTSLAQIPEHAVAATVGAARRAMPSQRETDRVFFSEIGARTAGLLQGTKEGLIEMARTLRTGDPSDEASKVENASMRAISGVKGSIIRTPTRLLSAEDELFKGMARRMELNGLAIRQARQEGLKGKAARERADAIVASPSDELLERSFDYGRYITFQTPLAHDSVPGMISRMTQNHPWLKLVLPFVRTPTNLLKFAAKRSPAAPLLRDWRRDIRAGGAKRDLAVAKTMVGTGVMALAAQWAASGTITGGGPADDSAKAAMRAQGWQPYSFKLGDTYYSYARLDPFATTLGIVADAIDLQSHMTEKERDQVGTLLLSSTLQNLSSKTWLSGVSDAASAIEDPNKVQSFVGRLAGSIAVPGGIAQVARTVDPVQRDARTILDRVRARVPFASRGIEARRDIWGRVIVNEGGLGPDIMSPIRTSAERPDPASAAILDSGARATLPNRRVAGRDLTPQEYGQYQATAGSLAHQSILARVQEPDWPRQPQDERSDAIANLMRLGRATARKELLRGERGSDAADDVWAAFEDAPPSQRRGSIARR